MLRIGQGYDVHQLVENRPLILGGVPIPFEKGLKGHSDADALLHAITDALFGALAMGDIGYHFPDTDPAFKGADSKVLLQVAYNKIKAQGWRLVNLDTTVIAQSPKLAAYILPMRQMIAELLELDVTAVSVKAKTNEKLGYLGRSEAIEAQAVCLLASQNFDQVAE